jgi:pimeloyl-ACP methyl ester carboxylesterase
MIKELKRMESFLYNSCRIHYKQIGKGHCIVLLHGYLENLEIWSGFADELSKTYQVLVLDIPEHGQSGGISDVNTIEGMAESVNATLSHLNIPNAVIVGHSMGGYVALAFAELFPAKTTGLCLFHSTPYADSEQKKLDRMHEVEQIDRGEKQTMVDASIPLRFAEKNLSKFVKELEWAKRIALKTSDRGIVDALKAMASRVDRNHVIENAIFPTLMIFGALDNHIPLSVAKDLAQKHKKTRTVFLNNSGHMGFIEERDQALNAICSFLE